MHLLAHRRGRGATPSQSASGTSSAIRVLSRDRGFPQFPHSSSLKTGRHLNSNDVEVHVRHLMPSPRCSSLTVGKHRKLAGSGVAGRHSRSMRRSLDHAAPASSSRRSPQRQGLLRRSETRAASVGARFLGVGFRGCLGGWSSRTAEHLNPQGGDRVVQLALPRCPWRWRLA